MTVKEALYYLASRGYPCSASTLRALVAAGRLRCYRPGLSGRGPMRFKPDRLDDFLREAEFGPAQAAPPAPRVPRPKPPKPPRPPAVGEGEEWRDRMKGVAGK